MSSSARSAPSAIPSSRRSRPHRRGWRMRMRDDQPNARAQQGAHLEDARRCALTLRRLPGLGRRGAAVVLVAGVIGVTTAAALQAEEAARDGDVVPTETASPFDCFDKLLKGAAPRIACDFPLIMTDKERADLKRITRGYITDARCIAAIDVSRAEIDSALDNPDHTYTAPELPVSCTVTFTESARDFDMVFVPVVTFEGGEAVAATPGMGPVKGASSALSWLVRAWVNRSDDIELGIVRIVNATLKRRRELRPYD